jgi:predicted permease
MRLRRGKIEREMERELRFHLEMETAENMRRGMGEEEAGRTARLSFGGVEPVKEAYRDGLRFRRLEEFWQDARYGARVLFKKPGFASVTILTLALGVGANTAIFTWLKAVYLQPLPGVAAGHRLVTLHSVLTRSGNRVISISYPDYKDYRDRNAAFSGLAAFNLDTFNLQDGAGRPERLWGSLVSGNYFDVLGARAALGRTFTPDEDRTPGTRPVVVISYGLWQRRFAADPRLVGKTVRLNNRDFTVVGVAAEGFRGSWVGLNLDLWTPVMMAPLLNSAPGKLDDRNTQWLSAIGRLKDGATFGQAQANMRGIAAQLARDYPQADEGIGATLFTLAGEPNGAGQMAPELAVLMAVAALVLLIACANVANLSLVAASGRVREMGVRTAMGAGRARLIRQMLTESALLAAAGGAAGLLLAAWLSEAMKWLLPPMGLPFSLNLAWDYRVPGFSLALTMVTAVAVGLAPALRATKIDPIVALRGESGASGAAGRRSPLRGALVVVQLAVSLVSLICAGLFIRTLARERKVDLGFDPERALLVSMDLFPSGYDEKRGVEFYRQLVARVAALPGVEDASLSNRVPPSLFANSSRSFEIEGYALRKDEIINLECETVAPRYFRTMKIPLAEGREFGESDRADSPLVAVVNETMARRYWGGRSPVGRRLRAGSDAWRVIIGVARDVKDSGAAEPTPAWVYYPLAQDYSPQMTLVTRTAGDPWLASAATRGVVRALDATLPLFDEKTLAEHSGVSLFLDRLAVIFLSAFGLVALALAAIGLYGVMAYTVARRRHEIGIRMALGARAGDVLRLVVGQGMRVVLIGMALGLSAALALTRVVKSMLFGVSATDPATFVSGALLLAGVALLACYLPARRATKVDPLTALRHD